MKGLIEKVVDSIPNNEFNISLLNPHTSKPHIPSYEFFSSVFQAKQYFCISNHSKNPNLAFLPIPSNLNQTIQNYVNISFLLGSLLLVQVCIGWVRVYM